MDALPHTIAILWSATFIFAVGLVLNTIVIAAIARQPRLHTPVNIMVGTLAALGLSLLGRNVVVLIYNLYHRQSAGTNSTACAVQGFASMMSATVYLAVLVIISFNRYDVICNRAIWTVRRTFQWVAGAVALSLLYIVFVATGIQQMREQANGAYCLFDWVDNQGVSMFPTLFIIVVGLGFVTFAAGCYYKAYRTYKAHAQTMKVSSPNIKTEMRLSYNVGLILVSFIIFWLPIFALIMCEVATGQLVNYIFDTVAIIFVTTNAVFTPMMFAVINLQLRRSVVALLTWNYLSNDANLNHSVTGGAKPSFDRHTSAAPDQQPTTELSVQVAPLQPHLGIVSIRSCPVTPRNALPLSPTAQYTVQRRSFASSYGADNSSTPPKQLLLSQPKLTLSISNKVPPPTTTSPLPTPSPPPRYHIPRRSGNHSLPASPAVAATTASRRSFDMFTARNSPTVQAQPASKSTVNSWMTG